MRENLRRARKSAGLTQQAMADKLGIGLRHYKKIESGESLGRSHARDVCLCPVG